MAAALIVTNTSNEDILLSVQGGDIVQQKPCNIIFPIARGW